MKSSENKGALSFTTSDVAVFTGVPPSSAVKVSLIKASDTTGNVAPGSTLSAMSIVCDLALNDGGLSLISRILTSIR
uniref:Uncharacterized protein n=1 Tax=Oryzias sinensis TaxID=183150 RepID=A0A8C7YGY2_9TELE